MAFLNKVQLIGHLGKDPEIQYLASGTSVTKFSLATTEKQKDRDPVTEWHNIVAFGKLSEICSEYLKKGSFVYVEGKLQTRKWEDKEGNKRSTTQILINHMQMLDKRKSNTEDYDAGGGRPDEDVPF